MLTFTSKSKGYSDRAYTGFNSIIHRVPLDNREARALAIVEVEGDIELWATDGTPEAQRELSRFYLEEYGLTHVFATIVPMTLRTSGVLPHESL